LEIREHIRATLMQMLKQGDSQVWVESDEESARR
jgi:hypothetical protein